MTVRGQGRSLQHGASKYHGGRSVYTPRSAISATLREQSLAKGFLLENVSTDALYPAFYLKKMDAHQSRRGRFYGFLFEKFPKMAQT